jgi:predicted NBD/HSP70 family sugar kinase
VPDSWLRYLDGDPPYGREIATSFRLAQLVRKRTLMSIDEASQVTRLAPGTVRKSVSDLERAGIVERPGRRDRFQLAAGAAWAVGIVFEADRVVALAFDLAYGFTERDVVTSVDVRCHEDPEAAFDAAAALIARTMRNYGRTGECLGVGLAAPVPVDNTGICRSELAGTWRTTRPADEVARRLAEDMDEVPRIVVDNAASLGALGIYLRRFSAPVIDVHIPRDLLYVRVAEQVGVGLVLKGKHVRGGHGLAGEIIHRPAGSKVVCGRCGRECFETVCSTTAIERAVNVQLGLPVPGAPLPAIGDGAGDSCELTMGRRLAALVAGREQLASRERTALLKATHDAARRLGVAISEACMLVDPTLVVLGGPLARDEVVGGRLADGVAEQLRTRGLPLIGDDEQQRPGIVTVAPTLYPLPELRGAAGFVIQQHADAWLWWSIERWRTAAPALSATQPAI